MYQATDTPLVDYRQQRQLKWMTLGTKRKKYLNNDDIDIPHYIRLKVSKAIDTNTKMYDNS